MAYDTILESLLTKEEIIKVKNFVVYEKSTGKIIRMGMCHPSMVEIQATCAEEMVLEGVASFEEHMVDINTQQIINKTQVVLDLEKIEKDKLVAEGETNKLILEKMEEILRKMAIDALVKEGKLK